MEKIITADGLMPHLETRSTLASEKFYEANRKLKEV